MSIPFSTTRATIERPVNPLQDPLTPMAWSIVATGVPCVLGSISGSKIQPAGSQVVKSGKGDFNPGVDIRQYDRITDEITGNIFDAGMVQLRIGFGLDHIEVELREVIGASSA